ncbi:MAG TPA: glycosyltransferase [Syntrophales bacterium]|nr:glycosyltransferase [Syntrophales bacterium]
MKAPRVSVVMSVYNDERYVKAAVESILHQTFRDFEFIIVNDGSTDGTREILSSFHDGRIQVFDQENRGLTASLNRGLALARGEYIARMDGDDVSIPERFAREVAFLDENPSIGLVGTFAYRMDTRGRRVNLYTYKTDPVEIRENLWVDCPFCHSAVMYRKACIDTVGGYRQRIGPAEDLDLWFRITEHFDGANIPEPLHSFRIDPLGVTVEKRFDQLRAGRLVRLLAEKRRETGHDPLDDWTEEELNETLEELYPKTLENIRAVNLANAIYLAEVFYVTGALRESACWLYRYLKGKPADTRGWKLLFKLAAGTALPPSVLTKIKRLRHP